MANIHTARFVAITNEAKAVVDEVTVEEVIQFRADNVRFHLVDVREDREWEAGRCEGAIHLGKGIIERDIEKTVTDPGAHLVLYCGGGYRSALAADALQRMGYTNVWSMAGGIGRWRELGLPEES